jgi:BlaI family penicillinase repressor
MEWRKRNKQPGTGPLTGLQLDLLRALWARGEATVTAVHEHIAGRHTLSAASVATVLKRLEKRGLIAHRIDGRAYVYRALVAEADIAERALDATVQQVFEGDLEAFTAQLLRRSDVSAADLARIRALIEARERELAECDA